MKKSLLSIVILALVFANFVLSAIIMLTLVPSTKQANELITKVCEAIHLEVNSGATNGLSNLPISQISVYKVKEGNNITTNLAQGNDGKAHYVVFAVSLNLNNQSEEYVSNNTTSLSEKESIILDEVNKVVRSYTLDEVNAEGGVEKMNKDMLKRLQNIFGSEYIVGISFPDFKTE